MSAARTEARLVFTREDVTCQVHDRAGLREIDRVAFDDPRLALRMRLICSRVRKGTEAPSATLVMPTDLVLRRPCPSSLTEGPDLEAFVETAFPDIPYGERHTVVATSRGARLILAVERTVAEEAADFALKHGFAPQSIAAAMPDGDIVLLSCEPPVETPVIPTAAAQLNLAQAAPTTERPESQANADLATMPMALRREMLRRRIVEFQKSGAVSRPAKAVTKASRLGRIPKFYELSVRGLVVSPLRRPLTSVAEVARDLPRQGRLRLATLSDWFATLRHEKTRPLSFEGFRKVAELRQQVTFDPRPVLSRLQSLPRPHLKITIGPAAARLRQAALRTENASQHAADSIRGRASALKRQLAGSADRLGQRAVASARKGSLAGRGAATAGASYIVRGGQTLQAKGVRGLTFSRALGRRGLGRLRHGLGQAGASGLGFALRSLAALRRRGTAVRANGERLASRALAIRPKLARIMPDRAGLQARVSVIGQRLAASARLATGRIGHSANRTAAAVMELPALAAKPARTAIAALPESRNVKLGALQAATNLRRSISRLPLLPLVLTGAATSLALAAVLLGPMVWQGVTSSPAQIAAIDLAVEGSSAPQAIVDLPGIPELPSLTAATDTMAVSISVFETAPQLPDSDAGHIGTFPSPTVALVEVASQPDLPTSLASVANDPAPLAIDRTPPELPSLAIATVPSTPIVLPQDTSAPPAITGAELPATLSMSKATVSAVAEDAAPANVEPSVVDVAPFVSAVPDDLDRSLRPVARPAGLLRANGDTKADVTFVEPARKTLTVVQPEPAVTAATGSLRVLAIAGSDRGRQALVQVGAGKTEILRVGSVTDLGVVLKINRDGLLLRSDRGDVFLPVGG